MKTFPERLRFLARDKNLLQVDLVGVFKKDKSTISKWWNGDIVPGPKNMRAIADYFKCDIGWLKNGSGPVYLGRKSGVEEPNVTLGPPTGKVHRIPVISWVQAGDWSEVSDPFQPGYAEEWVDTIETGNINAFALVVLGDSMEPEFTEGDIITVDPGRTYGNGSFVIAKNGEDATFKQLILDGSSVLLKPLNSRYPIKDMTGTEFRIVGVVVEKRKRY